jgi:uncharacterized protein
MGRLKRTGAQWDLPACRLIVLLGCMLLLVGCSTSGVLRDTPGQGDDSETVRRLDESCREGSYAACNDFGYMLSEGRGVAAPDFTRAVRLFESACSHGIGRGCASAGFLYQNGRGVPMDWTRAEQYYRSACDLRDGIGCNHLGALIEKGKADAGASERPRDLYRRSCELGYAVGCKNLGQALRESSDPEDRAQAVVLFQDLCDRNDRMACVLLGGLYSRGQGVPKSIGKAKELYRKACEEGEPRGCSSLGTVLVREGDMNDGLNYLETACMQGDPAGCINLGGLYKKGENVAKDAEKAAFYLRKGCDSQCEEACGEWIGISCGSLAPYYLSGVGGRKDEARALMLYDRACRFDFAPACFDLGYMYYEGRGTEPDLARAAGYYELACRLGLPDGCANAGMSYSNGEGVPADFGRALALFRRGCDTGGLLSCNNLGDLYENGRGVPKDLQQARTLYERACREGERAGCCSLHLMEYSQAMEAKPRKAEQWIPALKNDCQAGGCPDACKILLRDAASEP